MPRSATPGQPSLIPNAHRTSPTANYLWENELWDTFADQATDDTSATFTPINYEPGYAYPLVVWMHDTGADASELPLMMRHLSTRNYVAVAPYGFEHAGSAQPGWAQTSAGIELAEQTVADAIQSAQSLFHVNTQRVFVVGEGAGGAMALRLAMRRPEWFAGAASLDGPFPCGDRPLARINAVRSMPLLLCSAGKRGLYPEWRLCEDLALLHTAGCRVAVHTYPNCDDLTTNMLADLNRWMMALVTGQPIESQNV